MFRLLDTTGLVGEHNPLRHSVDLLSFWVPGPPSTWSNWFADVWISYAAHNREPGASAYPGYIVLLLSLIGVFGRRWRWQVIWWWGVALGFALLAMGPYLQIDGQILEVTLPYWILSSTIPAFSIAGIPGRFVVMTSLALAMLSASGLANLARWLLRASSTNFGLQASFGLCIMIGVLICLEYLAIPLHLSSTNLDPIYNKLAAEKEDYAIIDIKWDANFLMHAQTVHDKPLIGGWLARLPLAQAAYLNQDGLENSFLYLLLGPEGEGLSDAEAIQTALQSALELHDVRYIIDHDNRAGAWLNQVVGWPRVYEADGVVVYGMPR